MIAVVAATMALGVLAVAGWAGDPNFDPPTASGGPNPVTGGGDILYTVEFKYDGEMNHQALQHVRVAIDLPAGWTYAPPSEEDPTADPDVCTLTGSTLICERGAIRPGAVVTQKVKLRTGVVSALVTRTVKSRLTFDERDSDGSPGSGRTDNIPAPDVDVQVLPLTDNHFRTCADRDGDNVSTKLGASAANPLTTEMLIPGTTDLCSPVSTQELPADDPTVDACPEGVKCTTAIGITAAPQFDAADPITLTFSIYGVAKNIPWYKNAQLPAVPACSGDAGQASPDPCVDSRSKSSKVTELVVLWSGNDPSWQG
jgi:hypothetical protein